MHTVKRRFVCSSRLKLSCSAFSPSPSLSALIACVCLLGEGAGLCLFVCLFARGFVVFCLECCCKDALSTKLGWQLGVDRSFISSVYLLGTVSFVSVRIGKTGVKPWYGNSTPQHHREAKTLKTVQQFQEFEGPRKLHE